MNGDQACAPEQQPNVPSEVQELDNLLARAQELAENGEYEDAIDHLKQTIERFPESPLTHHNLGVVYLMLLEDDYSRQEVWEDLANDEWKFQAAVSEEETALDLDPNLIEARNNLGTLFALRGWWKDAIEEWEHSLSIRPDQPELREDLTKAKGFVKE